MVSENKGISEEERRFVEERLHRNLRHKGLMREVKKHTMLNVNEVLGIAEQWATRPENREKAEHNEFLKYEHEQLSIVKQAKDIYESGRGKMAPIDALKLACKKRGVKFEGINRHINSVHVADNVKNTINEIKEMDLKWRDGKKIRSRIDREKMMAKKHQQDVDKTMKNLRDLAIQKYGEEGRVATKTEYEKGRVKKVEGRIYIKKNKRRG